MKFIDSFFDDISEGKLKRPAVAVNYVLWATIICMSFRLCVSDFTVISIKNYDDIISYILKGEYIHFLQWFFLIAVVYFIIKTLLTTFLPLIARIQFWIFSIADKRNIPSYNDYFRKGKHARKDHLKHILLKARVYNELELEQVLDLLNIGVSIFLKISILSCVTLITEDTAFKWISIVTLCISIGLFFILEACLVYGFGLKKIKNMASQF